MLDLLMSWQGIILFTSVERATLNFASGMTIYRRYAIYENSRMTSAEPTSQLVALDERFYAGTGDLPATKLA